MGELLVLIAVGVLFFGAKRLPELFGAVFSSVNAFKKGLNEGEKDRPEREVKELSSPKKP